MKTVSVLLLAMLWCGCGGYSAPATAAPKAGFVPVIAAIVPNTTNHGDPAFTLTVNGSTFNSNAVVNWDGTAQNHSPPGREPAYRGDPRFSHRHCWQRGGHGNQPGQQHPRRSIWWWQ